VESQAFLAGADRQETRMNQASDPKALAAKAEPASDLSEAEANGILTIDLEAVVANWRALGSRAVPAECAAVVKADGYGCGAEPVARALASAGCHTFFVATIGEARRVRAAAPRAVIYVLDGFFAGTGPAFADIDARPVIGDLTELAEWDSFRNVSGWKGDAAIHIDTGMNRLGLSVEQAQAIVPRIHAPNHGISLVMSHFVDAEHPNNTLNGRQIADFREIARLFSGVPASLANTSGVFLGPQALFDMVRPGAGLYGVNPTPDADNPMKPVAEIKARIAQLRHVPKGGTVGYGATWTARRPTRIAIVAVGYADGYFRAAGGVDGVRSGEVVVSGQRCPIAGRISMDLLAVDVTDVAENEVRRGTFVTLLGEGITVDELGHHFGTIGYEVLTSFGPRYRRVYREPGA
jgi:alanine racemase